MPNNNDKLPGFARFDELTGLLKDFVRCSLTECRRARLSGDEDGQLGDAEKIKQCYEEIHGRPLDSLSSLATFNIVYDNDGNWIAFLASGNLKVATERFYYGREHDWQIRLADVVIRMYGLEPTDYLRKRIWLTV